MDDATMGLCALTCLGLFGATSTFGVVVSWVRSRGLSKRIAELERQLRESQYRAAQLEQFAHRASVERELASGRASSAEHAAYRAMQEAQKVSVPKRRAGAVHWGAFDGERPVSTVTAVDVETTGLDPRTERVVEIAFVRSDGVTWSSFVNPGRPIPDEARKFHGISDEDVSGAPDFGEVWDEAKRRGFLAGYPTAYNAPFDQSMIVAELVRAGRTDEARYVADLEFIDPLVRARAKNAGLPSALTDEAARLGVPLTGAHRALADATACLGVFYAHERESPNFSVKPLAVAIGNQLMERERRKQRQ